jgi:hypothetical protein
VYTKIQVAATGLSEKEENNSNSLIVLLIDQFNQMNAKLDRIIGLIQENNNLHSKKITFTEEPEGNSKRYPDVLSLISLPGSLRKTIMTLYELEKAATAEELSKETKRMRAVESAAANQLVRLGYIKKKREGRDVLFYLEPTSQEGSK